ncbi:hypothetical protein ES703_87523 [subsurface metagenome]
MNADTAGSIAPRTLCMNPDILLYFLFYVLHYSYLLMLGFPGELFQQSTAMSNPDLFKTAPGDKSTVLYRLQVLNLIYAKGS